MISGAGRSQQGLASAHAAWVAVGLIMLALIVVQAAQLILMRHQVAASADLAALAGSRASVAGADGCASARKVALSNGARLVGCRMDFDVATVRARAVSRTWWGKRWVAEQKARAAPIEYVAPPTRGSP